LRLLVSVEYFVDNSAPFPPWHLKEEAMTKKLTLSKDTVRKLTTDELSEVAQTVRRLVTDELREVAGGGGPHPWTGYLSCCGMTGGIGAGSDGCFQTSKC
jgi:hypothetical protein